ncbi:speckle-type POZ protein-like B [Trichonephila clavipes]|nr:speckle-type POZ protein-like B [Trichonephila clavipes]
MSLRIGDLTVLNVLIWKAFVQSYIEKTVSSLIFAHQCIYTGKLAADLTLPLVGDLLFATNKYKLTGLITACCKYLKEIIFMGNAIDILELGDLYDPGVKALALEFLCKNIYKFGVLEETEKWKNLQKEKPSLAFEVLTSLVKYKCK